MQLINPEARKWERFPTLRLLLEEKRIPDHYYGPSSVSNNVFNELHGLIEILILAKENADTISSALKAKSDDRPTEPALHHDLCRLREAYESIQRTFQGGIKEIDAHIGKERRPSPAHALALCLAWYMNKYGDIPAADMVRLVRLPFDKSEDADALRRRAEQIREEFGVDER